MVHPRFEGEMNGLQNDVFLKLKNQTVVDLQAANVCDKICCAPSSVLQSSENNYCKSTVDRQGDGTTAS